MKRRRAWIPYLWAVVLGGFAWYATHYEMVVALGLPPINEFDILPISLLIFAAYAATLIACYQKAITLHQLGHLAVFEAATVLGFHGSNLQCMGAIIYFYMVAAATGIVVSGAVVLAVARLLTPRANRVKH